MVLPTVNRWGKQVVRFIYVVRIDEFCYTMYTI